MVMKIIVPNNDDNDDDGDNDNDDGDNCHSDDWKNKLNYCLGVYVIYTWLFVQYEES